LAAAVLATAGIARARTARAGNEFLVFRFDPSGIDPVTGTSCRGCGACRRHAAHKLYATIEAADARRAHPHCRCVITAVAVSRAEFEELFGGPETGQTRAEFDARWRPELAIPAALDAGGLEMPVVRVR
jgi:hypothetical protein